uniref:Stomatal closure-related actin-binding protein coiled-coil domain-containing protein n=2 Tax=Oryza glumipatula TaxID=40148 RepID=A0A0D9YGA8_9ORYZ
MSLVYRLPLIHECVRIGVLQMTRVIHDSGEGMQKEALAMVSSDVNFPKGHFPDYKIGPNNQIIDPEEIHEAVPLKEIVAKETAQLLEQRRRLSVRDLKEKFEKGLSGASKLSEEAKRREAASLDRQVLLKKLRDVLDTLKGRVAGRNRDDADEAISLVEALAVQLTQREGELIYEKAEVKKLASFLKQATEDARKVAEEERALALAEIEKARTAIAIVEKGLQEHDAASSSREKEEIEGLRKEVREARRIKMLHQPSKVMDMEFELKALRTLIAEKNQLCNQLMKELAMIKRLEEDSSDLYDLEGSDILGSQFCIIPRFDDAPDISSCPTQWYRVISGGNRNLILGATKPTYAPEPFDVGRLLQAEIVLNAEKVTIQTMGPINPAAGLERYVESLMKRADVEFNVVVTQMNGNDYSSNSVHAFHIGKMRIKLRKGWSTKARESYSTTMKLCGSRGGGNAAATAVFWQARKGLSYTLAFETDRDRNAAIMLARKFASNCNITLTGPGDEVHAGS